MPTNDPTEKFHYLSSSLPCTQCSFRPILRTPRLTLTIIDSRDSSDTEFCLRCADYGFSRTTTDNPGFDTAEKWHAFRSATKLLPKHTPYGQQVSGPAVYCVRLDPFRDDGERIGLVLLNSRDEDVDPDLGWVTLTPHLRQGYASEAAKRLLEYFQDEFQGGMRNASPPIGMTAFVNDTNMASVGVARRIGMEKVGELSMLMFPSVTLAVYGFPDEVPSETYTTDQTINVFGVGDSGLEVAKMLGLMSLDEESNTSDSKPVIAN